jgi:nitrogen fixation protein FixH
MNMGNTQLKFEPKGDGVYEASLKEMDMSGPWTLTVDASGKDARAQKSFDFVVGE